MHRRLDQRQRRCWSGASWSSVYPRTFVSTKLCPAMKIFTVQPLVVRAAPALREKAAASLHVTGAPRAAEA
jgi:hypothetical protein